MASYFLNLIPFKSSCLGIREFLHACFCRLGVLLPFWRTALGPFSMLPGVCISRSNNQYRSIYRFWSIGAVTIFLSATSRLGFLKILVNVGCKPVLQLGRQWSTNQYPCITIDYWIVYLFILIRSSTSRPRKINGLWEQLYAESSTGSHTDEVEYGGRMRGPLWLGIISCANQYWSIYRFLHWLNAILTGHHVNKLSWNSIRRKTFMDCCASVSLCPSPRMSVFLSAQNCPFGGNFTIICRINKLIVQPHLMIPWYSLDIEYRDLWDSEESTGLFSLNFVQFDIISSSISYINFFSVYFYSYGTLEL